MDEATAAAEAEAQPGQPTAEATAEVGAEPAAAKEEAPPAAQPVAAPNKRRGRPPGSKNKPKAPPTVDVAPERAAAPVPAPVAAAEEPVEPLPTPAAIMRDEAALAGRHPSAQPQRQHLQIQPLLPGRIPAIHAAVGRKSKAAHLAGSGHRERLRTELTSIIAAGASGVGQAAQNFGFRNAARAANAVEQRVFPQIIGRPTDAQRVIEQAGQRAQEIQRAAAQDIEQFVAEQAAAETADITPLLAETGAGAGEAAGVGALEVLGGAVGAVVAPEVAIPAAIGLAAGAGGA